MHKEEKAQQSARRTIAAAADAISAAVQVARSASIAPCGGLATIRLAPHQLFLVAMEAFPHPTLSHFIPESVAWRGIEWTSLVFLLVSWISHQCVRFASCSASASKPCTVCALEICVPISAPA